MAKSYLPPEKRVDKTPLHLKEDFVFDLVNAFGLVKNPVEAALLLQDLLTKKELDNLGKRLAVAKRLLRNEKYDEIATELHCGLTLIAKVQTWLRDSGEGLRNTISRLPKRRRKPQYKRHSLPTNYRLPQLLFEYTQHLQASRQDAEIKKFIDKTDMKAIMDKSLQEAFGDYYRNKKHK